MKKIPTLVVDDEPLAREGIKEMLRHDPDIEVIGDCGDGESALTQIRNLRPQLVFLDVQMPRLDGLEVYQRLFPEERPAVIFVTAYNQYAVAAFDMCAADYLLKPFRDSRFQAALTRAKEQVRRADFVEMQKQARQLIDYLQLFNGANPPATAASPSPKPAAASRLVFKVAGEHLFLQPSELIWIEAKGEFVKLNAGKRTYLVREPLHLVEKRLDSKIFIRIHRSFIVNADHVKKITPTLYGDHDVIASDDSKIRLSRTYRDKLKVLLSATGDGTA